MLTEDGHTQLGNVFSQRQRAARACRQGTRHTTWELLQDRQPRGKTGTLGAVQREEQKVEETAYSERSPNGYY